MRHLDRGTVEAIPDLSNLEPPRFFLIQNTNLVETYLGKFLVTKLKSGFFRCSDVSGERTRLACWFRRRAETVFCLNVARLRCG
ncbi:MAG: hypothetical protein DMF10_09430, partial [Verrucomicrobia bacterium]